MITTPSSFTRLRRRLRLATVSVPTVLGLALLGGNSLYAKPIPDNLGNGLGKLAQSNAVVTQANKTGTTLAGAVTVGTKVYMDDQAASYASLALTEASTGRVMVRVYPNGQIPFDRLTKQLTKKLGSFQITATDSTYKGVGLMEGYISVEEAAALGTSPGVNSVILELKPRHNKPAATTAVALPGRGPVAPLAANGAVLNKIGTAFDQGVTQHKVDTINRTYNGLTTGPDFEGQGMQIACMSNSFDADATGSSATDVANGDLPGAGNPVNTTPVYIFQDDPTGAQDDEGRAMCQIAFKMCPKATIAYATANFGELGFANNIRGLAGITGFTKPGQTFAADCICDDVGYFDEPFFQDGIIAQGIESAAAAGVSYFSSAANDIGVNGYDSDTRWVASGTGLTAAAGNTALTGTNIDLTGVPTNLYAGGFHNFNPNGLDVAQTVNIASNANEPPTDFQWNDPYDQNTTPTGASAVFTGSGTYTTAAVNFTITTPVTAGLNYQFVEAATNASGFDGIVTVYKSDGVTVLAGPQDTGTDETVRLKAPTNDTGFVVKVDHYGTTTGTFTLTVTSYTGFNTPGVTTSLSLLVFNLTTGAYISTSSLTADATVTNEPIQLGATLRPTGATQVQYVIARSTVPAAGFSFPTHVRYLIAGNGLGGVGPAEYFTYNGVTTGGHAVAPNCNGACAYPFYRPNIPESFSSPGPVMIYFDTNDNRLATPQVRLKPTIAACDGTNTDFFSSDSTYDTDANPNFFGTSAASPHSMACGALALQAHGGRRSLTPAQLTSVLERSTFPHDLDPGFSSGAARVTGGTTGSGKVTITCNSDSSTNGGTGGNDNNTIAISYVGGSSISTFVFNPQGTAATAGNTTGGNNGVQYSTTASGGTATYFSNDYPGMVFNTAVKAVTVGSASTVPTTNVIGAQSNIAGLPSTTQGYTLTLTVTGGVFTGGNVLRFNVGRQIQHSAVTGNTAGTIGAGSTLTNYNGDLLGGSITIPGGLGTGTGMTFSGTTADGGTFTGTINNRIGSGYSVLDGYGFIDASVAVTQTVQ